VDDRFIRECRREWRRLRVPDAIANEMAADLEADLREAESDGASAEEVVGTGLFDARSFAAAWAAERGVIPAATSKRGRFSSASLLVPMVVLALVTALGAGMVIAGRTGGTGSVTLAAGPPRAVGPDLHACGRAFLPWDRPGPPPVLPACPPMQRETIVGHPPPGAVRSVFVRAGGSGLEVVGWTLLLAGLAGIVLLLLVQWLFWDRLLARASEVS
jgi:hypothetical protein